MKQTAWRPLQYNGMQILLLLSFLNIYESLKKKKKMLKPSLHLLKL